MRGRHEGPGFPGPSASCALAVRPGRPARGGTRLRGLVVLARVLRAVLAAVLVRLRILAEHVLAIGGDDVERVGEDRVIAGTAVDVVDLTVADVDPVVPVLAEQRVAERVARGGDVAAGERPQVVVAVP